jgi:hypothetical protein
LGHSGVSIVESFPDAPIGDGQLLGPAILRGAEDRRHVDNLGQIKQFRIRNVVVVAPWPAGRNTDGVLIGPH